MVTRTRPEPVQQTAPGHIETNFYRISVHNDDIVEFVIKTPKWTSRLAREAKERMLSLCSGKKYILATSDGFFAVTRAARHLAASPAFSGHMTAVAFYTSSYSFVLLGELYNKINKPAVPTRVFTNRQDAEDWLLSLKRTGYEL